jgi:hypothetical protein
MFEIKRVLTNVRPKNEEAVLTVAPTKGILKVSETAATRLGLGGGDYVSVLEAQTEEGLSAFVFKGNAKDEENGINQVGSKCDFSNNGVGGTLQFSSGNAWKTLNGDGDNNVKYAVSETPVVQDGISYFKLTFVSKTPKTIKNATEKVATSNSDGAMVEVDDTDMMID